MTRKKGECMCGNDKGREGVGDRVGGEGKREVEREHKHDADGLTRICKYAHM